MVMGRERKRKQKNKINKILAFSFYLFIGRTDAEAEAPIL